MISVISAVSGGRPTTRLPQTLKSSSPICSTTYKNPVRVVGFNTSEGWSRDVSEDAANELQYRCDWQGDDVPAGLEGFIERHIRRDRAQLRLV